MQIGGFDNLRVDYRQGYLACRAAGASLRLEKICCAAEWIGLDGVIRRMESARMPESAPVESARWREIKYAVRGAPQIAWRLRRDPAGLALSVVLANNTGQALRVRKLQPLVMDFTRGARLELGCPLPQAWWFDQGALTPTYLWPALYRTSLFKSAGMGCLYDVATGKSVTIGFLTLGDWPGNIRLDFDGRAPERLCAENPCGNRLLMPGESIVSEQLLIRPDHSARLGIEAYAGRVGGRMRVRCPPGAPSGWSTWDYYFNDVNEDCVLENVGFLARHRDDFPVEYIQIDSGYAAPWGQWRKWDRRKFPHGPRWLVRQIRRQGFKAGLWAVPYFVLPESPEALRHPAWLVRDEDGGQIRQGRMLALDGSHPGAQAWLKNLAALITAEWGFDYVKLDGANAIGAVAGLRHDPAASGVQAYRRGLQAFRAGMRSGAYLLGAAFAPSVGLVDGARLGGDVGARWDWSGIDVHRGERDRYHGSGNVKRQVSAALNGAYQHRRFWINDADYLVVRDDKSELTRNEARLWATVLGLYGGTVLLGDRMTTLAEERRKIAAAVFPLYPASAYPVDFLKNEIPELLAMDVRNQSEQWKIIALFNYADKPAIKTVDFGVIGLDEKHAYHAREFWDGKYLGKIKGCMIQTLEPHSCKVFALRRDCGAPQLVGTDMHITQGGVEVERVVWNKRNRLAISLAAPGRKSGHLYIALPRAMRLKSIRPVGIKAAAAAGGLISLGVEYSGKACLTLNFA